jgi:hypothetical protein
MATAIFKQEEDIKVRIEGMHDINSVFHLNNHMLIKPMTFTISFPFSSTYYFSVFSDINFFPFQIGGFRKRYLDPSVSSPLIL